MAVSREIASSFWGRAWCRNIETYRELDGRLAQGRTCLRKGQVRDLRFEGQRVIADIAAEERYQVSIRFAVLDEEQWQNFCAGVEGELSSLVDFLAGKLPESVIAKLTDAREGLFPSVREIKFSCTCLDDADICRHVAAVLYEIGVRFDHDPAIFFSLRGVDPSELLGRAKTVFVDQKPVASGDLGSIFGIDIS